VDCVAVSAALEDNLELYAGAAELGDEVQRATRNSALAWRVVRFLATMQLRDAEVEHQELKAMLEGSIETERTALTAVLERAKWEILR
jgi:hypothetical protein